MSEFVEDIAPYLWLIGIPLLFLAIVAYVFRPSARARYREHARIPLNHKRSRR